MKLVNRIKLNKNGSSIVLLAMVFVAMMLAITASISIARALVVKSECESFGHLWTKSILSEYDVHLLEEYGLQAFWGNDAEVQKRIDSYLDYSASSKLDAKIGKSSASLMGYELGDPENFKKAMKEAFATSAIDSVVNDSKRGERSMNTGGQHFGSRMIKNTVVLDTLPSGGISNTIDIDSIVAKLKQGNFLENLGSGITTAATEIAFLNKYFGTHISKGDFRDGYFCNEWEYVLNGKCDDEANFSACKRKIFLIRNALNLAYLYKDPEKMAVITAIAETLAPGVAGVLSEAIIAEAWAAVETESDMEILLDNGRVPFMKTSASWRTDIGAILGKSEITGQLSKEGKEILNDKRDEFENMSGANGRNGTNDGQSYDDYLMAMIMLLNENVRTLRVMDIIQINMKYWYYEDFNMMEYFTGVRFSIEANRRNYDFEDAYE